MAYVHFDFIVNLAIGGVADKRRYHASPDWRPETGWNPVLLEAGTRDLFLGVAEGFDVGSDHGGESGESF